MLDQINLAGFDAKGLGDVFCWPLLAHITIENLEVLRLNLALDPLQCRVEHLSSPLLIPNRIQADPGWIRDTVQNGRARRRGGRARFDGLDTAVLLSQVIVDSALRD